MSKFAEHKSLDLTRVNSDVLASWKKNDVFHRSIDEREGCPEFVFFEGPPSANGHPGIHHVMGRTIKDTFLRYKTMQGFQVKRKAGWDTHGLPVELSVEKELGITKEDIGGPKVSVDGYNQKCRENVMMYTSEWSELTDIMGYWVDLEHPYITYDNKYIETLWWLLKQLYQKGLLYKGYTIQPYSPAAGTGLSSHELNQPGCYRDVKDTTATVQFKLTPPQPSSEGEGAEKLLFSAIFNGHANSATLENVQANSTTPSPAGEGRGGVSPVYILAWTTTPWTLPSNTALCVGPKIDYVAVKGKNPYSGEEAIYILAEARLKTYFPEIAEQLESQDISETLPLSEGVGGGLIWRGKGSDLVGLHYEQLLPWVKPCALENDNIVVKEAEAFRVIPGDYVTTEDGTGIVHIAPTFGADDAKVAKDAGIPSLFIVDKAGDTRPMVDFTGKYFVREDMDPRFVELCVMDSYWHHSGHYVKNAYDPKYNQGGKYDEKAAQKDMDLNVIMSIEMKEQGKAFRVEKHTHNYPHCWRTDKPVLYYPLDSWFIRSTACKERMAELNKTIKWKPESTGTGRFGKWLENLNDWNLSRSRYWGTPLPIWRNRDTKEEICIGSLEELYNEIEKAVEAGVMASNPLKDKGFVPGDMSQENYDRIDMHRPYVDYIKLVGKDGSVLTRETDLIDVWFDSGAMPYAQIHYPFENKQAFDERKLYPADFIAEGVDQTRGWFFTLHAIATMVFDSVAYKAVISNGLVLDKNGVKMSKRLGNVIDPFDCIGTYGADAVRWYMITNSSPWDNLSFDPDGVKEVTSQFFIKLHQAYSFFTLYANVDGWLPTATVAASSAGGEERLVATNTDGGEEPPVLGGSVAESTRPAFDRWLLSELNTLVKNVNAYLEDYDPTPAGRLIQDFVVDKLSNWYIRLNKARFWGKEMTADKQSAYETLYTALETLARLIAPIAPYYADQLYCDLKAPVRGEASAEEGNLAPSHKEEGWGGASSVHLAKFPVCDESLIDSDLEATMEAAMKLTSMGLSIRKNVKIPVTQVLQSIAIPDTDKVLSERVLRMADIIAKELNVKEVTLMDASLLVKTVKCNFRVMGKKFGKQMKAVAAAVGAMTQEQIAELEQKGNITLPIGDGQGEALIELADVDIMSQDIPGWSVANEGTATVALDITITPELKLEGDARRVIRQIQGLRKSSGLEITDRIRVTLEGDAQQLVEKFGQHISSQVLATSLAIGTAEEGEEVDLDTYKLKVSIEKA